MTPATIIRGAQADGVSLTLSPSGAIKATGDGAAVNCWLTVIREHKAEIIDALKTGAGRITTACKTCAYVTGRGGCGNPVEAGLSDVAGVIGHDIMGGINCAAHKPSTVPTGSLTDCFDALPIPSHQTGRKNTPQSTLEGRIFAMAARWNYSGDELALVLEGAKADPVGWAAYCDHDEALSV